MAAGWDPSAGSFPAPPRNLQVFSAFQRGKLDIRWDDPQTLSANTQFAVVGVNIYRAYNDRGPYQRLNPFPVGGTIWRDQTDNALVSNEIVDWNTAWCRRGDSVVSQDTGITKATLPEDVYDGNRSGQWTFRTQYPINKQYGQGAFGNNPYDVAVFINGERAIVEGVFGNAREVTLVNRPVFDPVTEKNIPPVLPTGPDDEVLVCYFTTRNLVVTNLDAKPVYRVTTVALDDTAPGGMIETPLNFTEPIALRDTERLDWQWREAIMRNNWILQQGGERVLLFARKRSGIRCRTCFQGDPRREAYQKQPREMCLRCFGVGFEGGYDGPFEITIAPDQADRNVSQTPAGRALKHSYETWTGPSPQITHRDLVVKQNNERYAIGPVTNYAARGHNLQQHFNIGYLDETNIVYRLPLDGTITLPFPETRGAPPILQGGAWPVPPNPPGPHPVGPDQVHPLSTEKENIPDDREQRGRTRVWENITY